MPAVDAAIFADTKPSWSGLLDKNGSGSFSLSGPAALLRGVLDESLVYLVGGAPVVERGLARAVAAPWAVSTNAKAFESVSITHALDAATVGRVLDAGLEYAESTGEITAMTLPELCARFDRWIIAAMARDAASERPRYADLLSLEAGAMAQPLTPRL